VEVLETWQSLVSGAGYSVSPLPSPVEATEGFNPNEFMVNIGLALKELPREKGETNFSLVNFNALPDVYLPKALPVARILVYIGITAGIALVVYAGILIQGSLAHNAALRSQLAVVDGHITEQLKGIVVLKEEIEQLKAQIEKGKAQIEEVEANTGVFNTKLVILERGRVTVAADLRQIVTRADGKVNLTRVNHVGSSVTVNGVAQAEGDIKARLIFDYARDLRNSSRFSEVIISSITQIEDGFIFEFSLVK